jgi:hypothetical protein
MFPTVALAQAGLFAGMAGLTIIVWTLVVLASIFWLWMLVDALTSNMEPTEKLLWFFVIFFLHLLGAVIYYVVKRSDTHRPHAV